MATTASNEGWIRTPGGGGGAASSSINGSEGLRFLERAISNPVARLTAVETGVTLHSRWKHKCKTLMTIMSMSLKELLVLYRSRIVH